MSSPETGAVVHLERVSVQGGNNVVLHDVSCDVQRGAMVGLDPSLRPEVFQRGLPMMGIFPLFSMFLVASIAMLRERRSGTLERLMSLPTTRLGLVAGYAGGFAAVACVQTAIVMITGRARRHSATSRAHIQRAASHIRVRRASRSRRQCGSFQRCRLRSDGYRADERRIASTRFADHEKADPVTPGRHR